MRKLWVTGTGACGAAGNKGEEIWQRLLAGDTSAARCFERNFTIYPADEFDGGLLLRKDARRMDRVAQLGCAAVREAMGAAEISPSSGDALLEEVGLVAGTGRGPIATLSEMFMRSARGAPTFPTQVAAASMSSVVAHLANHARVGGMCFVVSTACTSGAAAIVTAADLMQGTHRMMIAGGTDAPLDPVFLRQFGATGVFANGLSPATALRPFQLDRCGTALGEGAGFLVLERAGTPRAIAALVGWGMHFVARERQLPEPEGRGLAGAISRALDCAGLGAEEIDVLVLHANGTVAGDEVEHRALVRAFGRHLEKIPCVALKAVTGHCFGGSSGMEAVVAVEIVRRGLVPPTANGGAPAWNDVDLVAGQPRKGDFRTVLCVASGFWGNHTALIFAQA